MRPTYRHTKIIFTIGPATSEEDILEQLLNVGVDICRLNMAHASHEWTRQTIATVRKVCAKVDRQIAFMMDVKGPEIRTGDLEEDILLEKGEIFDFLIKPQAKDPRYRGVTVNYPGLSNDVSVGNIVLVDSGLIRMEVLEISPDLVRCKVVTPGPMGNRRHINLPGIKVNLPCLTQKDRNDIKVGIECGICFFALSFVREPDDLDILRRYISDNGSNARIIAKIEDQSGITNLEEIIKASDGLMVARGDLGIEIPYETLPIVQHKAVLACKKVGKPVIIATHMLESMITSPMPTRAEITDVSNAVIEQADCVMLSGETTVGKYPVECVDVLNRIIKSMEGIEGPSYNTELVLKNPKAAMLRSAVTLANEIPDCGILAFTRSGYITNTLSALRPRHTPIFGFTEKDNVFKSMLIQWGVEPFLMDFNKEDPEETISRAITVLKKYQWVSSGQNIVIVTNLHAKERICDTIQIRVIE